MRYLCKEALLDMLYFVRKQAIFIEETTAQTTSVEDFLRTQNGMILYNSTCMCLQTIGETLRKVDDLTKRQFLPIFYPQIPWKSIYGLRNIISHEYEDTDPDEIYRTIKNNISEVIATVNTIISDVQKGRHDDFLNSHNKDN